MKEKYNLDNVYGDVAKMVCYVQKAMRAEGKTEEEVHYFYECAMATSYDNLIASCFSKIRELNKDIESNKIK